MLQHSAHGGGHRLSAPLTVHTRGTQGGGVGRVSFPRGAGLRALSRTREGGGPGSTQPCWCAGTGPCMSLVGPASLGRLPQGPLAGEPLPPGLLSFVPMAASPVPGVGPGRHECPPQSGPASRFLLPTLGLPRGVLRWCSPSCPPGLGGRQEPIMPRTRADVTLSSGELRGKWLVLPALWVTAVPLRAALQGLGQSDCQESRCLWDPQESGQPDLLL